MNILLYLFLVIILILSPYQKGLFFDRDFYMIEFMIMLVFLAWVIYQLISKKNRLPLSYYIVFLIPLMYILSFLSAESVKSNIDNVLRWLTYGSFFVLLLGVRKLKLDSKYLELVLPLFGIILGLFSIFGYMGWFDYKDLVLGQRLTGPFQYANTFAAVIGALWLYSLVSLSSKQLNRVQLFMYSFPLVIYGVCFLLSYSRGAFLIIPIAWLIGLLLLKFREQISLIVITFMSLIGSLISFALFTQREEPALGLLSVIIFSVIILGLLFYSNNLRVLDKLRFLQKPFFVNHGYKVVSVVVVVVAALLLLDILNQGLVYKTLPNSLQKRIDQVDLQASSVLGRTNMYEDAFRISKDYPILGAGGDGWKVLYPSYQNEPYLSNEIHNGYLEVLLDIGWLGLLVFVGVMAIFILAMIRQRKKEADQAVSIAAGISALAMLFIHSAIDFNFSYGVIWFVIFWLIGTMISHEESLFKVVPDSKLRFKPQLHAVGKSILSLVIIIGIVFAYRFYLAEQRVASVQGSISFDDGIKLYEAVHKFNPYHVDYSFNLVSLYAQRYRTNEDESYKEKALNIIKQMEKMEPRNARVQYYIGRVYSHFGMWDESFRYLDQALAYDPFNTEYIDFTLYVKTQVGLSYFSSGLQNEGELSLNEAIEDYSTYQAWYQEFEQRSIPDRRPIHLNKESHLLVARAHLTLHQYPEAFSILKQLNPNYEEGIYDAEQAQLNVEKFDFVRLSDFLRAYQDQIIILSVKDEATQSLSGTTMEWMASIGSNIGQLGNRGSYAAVIVNGEVIEEQIDNEGQVLTGTSYSESLSERFSGQNIEIVSAGYTVGNHSSIKVNGQEYSKNTRGINIAIFDQNLNHLGSFNFDTHMSDIYIYKTQP